MIDAYPSQVNEPVVNNKCNHSTNLSTIDIHDALSAASKMHANVSMNANNMATKRATRALRRLSARRAGFLR